MRKAQISMEFTIVLVLLILILVGVTGGTRMRKAHMQFVTDQLAAKRIADRVSNTVSRLVVLGDGANESYYIPSQLDGRTNYTLQIHNESHLLGVSWGGQLYTSTLVTARFNASNISTGRKVVFENIGGVISFG
jgi:hypothetical protein